MSVTLIGGGARSGKSRFAIEYAEKRFRRLGFVATATAGDQEIRSRIARHQSERGDRWPTVADPLEIVSQIVSEASQFEEVVIDVLIL